MKTVAFIDGANLHKGSKEKGVRLNYKKLRGWLRQKYHVEKVYLFIGLIPQNTKLYERLQEQGYLLIFKETITHSNGETKGNCDAELVLKTVSDYYENKCNDFVIITGDGDFRCLVDFLIEKKSPVRVLAPNRKKCSILLKRTNVPIVYLDEQYHKLT